MAYLQECPILAWLLPRKPSSERRVHNVGIMCLMSMAIWEYKPCWLSTEQRPCMPFAWSP